jgi:Bacterial capsule synthesis protein PGA_cap
VGLVLVGLLGCSGAAGESSGAPPGSTEVEPSAPEQAVEATDAPAVVEILPDPRGTTLPVPASTSTTLAPTTTTTEPPPPEWSMLIGGDVLMDRSEASRLDPFAGVVPPLSSADLAVVNSEQSIGTGGTPAEKEFTFLAPPSAAATLAGAGIDIVSLGNNHAKDFGPDVFAQTRQLLAEAGILAIGGGADREEAFAPASLDVKGVKVAVFGATTILPGGFAAGDGRSGVASVDDDDGKDRLVAAVRAAKAFHPVVIVFLHWGVERDVCPAPEQTGLAARLVEAGATAVVGAHPHVLQPIVAQPGSLIAYSLGNFVFHTRTGPVGETIVLELRFEGATLTGFAGHPHELSTGVPLPAGPEAAQRITDRLNPASCGL